MALDIRPLSYDPLTGISETFVFDEMTNQVTIESTQDVTAIIELNKAQFNNVDERARWSPDEQGPGVKVASLPMQVYFDLQQRGILPRMGKPGDKKKFMAWLNDPENRFFRTRPGTV